MEKTSSEGNSVPPLSRGVSFQKAEIRPELIARCETRSHIIARIPTRKELKTLTHLAKRPAINIDFKDVSYTTRAPLAFKGSGVKTILNSISGSFRSGEVTAILGPSGAGKSTLLNILAGYVTIGVAGTIETNGHSRHLHLFHKLSSYIMQDDLLQPFLTVEESMSVAAHLKLGKELLEEDKRKSVDEILQTLMLANVKDVRTEQLSGGQRKRLSVALELVSNPPVIFLDEPTTGLDIVSSKQLVDLLKVLARQGRTIITTVHQPSSSIFKHFDLVYVLTAGQCVYQGAHQQLVPFLASSGFQCPITHNPADYVMETIHFEIDLVKELVQKIQNGKLRLESNEDKQTKLGVVTKICRQETVAQMPRVYGATHDPSDMDVTFPTTYLEQTWILFKRKLLQQSRSKTTIWIMIAHHVAAAVLIGMIFIGVGNDASRPFENFKFLLSCVVFFMYTHVMVNVLLYPFEVSRIKREYFNRWYGLKSYFTAHTLSTLPLQLILGTVFNVIVYLLSYQPIEFTRMLWFQIIGIILGLVSEGHGMTVGALFKVMNGCVVGPVTVVPMLAMGVYGMGFGPSIEPIMKFLMHTSYIRFGVIAYSTALYTDRKDMVCNEDYCHYKNTSGLLRDLGMENQEAFYQVLALFGFLMVFRITSFLALRQKLSIQWSNKIYNYMAKVLRL